MKTTGIRYVLLVGVLLLVPMMLSAQSVLFSTEGTFAPGDTVNGNGAFTDTYQVRVEGGSLIEVVAESEMIDTSMEAVLPDGSSLYNDDYRGFNAGFLRVMPGGGTLQFSVSPLYSDEEGPYSVTVREMSGAQAISIGEVIQDRFGKGKSSPGIYQLAGRSGQMVTIDLISDDFDAYLQIIDSDGNEYSDDDSGGDYNSRITYQFETSGTVMVLAQSLMGDGLGAYELRTREAAQNLVVEYQGTLEEGDSYAYDGTVYDRYEYAGSAGEEITIALESTDFDAVVYISNPDGTSLGYDDDGGMNGNSRASVTLPENGTYAIFARSFGGDFGTYRLRIYN